MRKINFIWRLMLFATRGEYMAFRHRQKTMEKNLLTILLTRPKKRGSQIRLTP
jgi:hypothetical protein